MVIIFCKGISLKVSLIARQEFELTYYNVAVQHISHYLTGIHPWKFEVLQLYSLGGIIILTMIKYPNTFTYIVIYCIAMADNIVRHILLVYGHHTILNLVGWGCRVHQMHLCSGVRYYYRVSWIWRKNIKWWGLSWSFRESKFNCS